MGRTFKSAIFFDMENLLKGYRLDVQALGRLSLKEIVQAIKEREGVTDLAVQRAYAHWSNRSLEIMRREIMELGIEPVQIFGFSYETRKDAADIQLAIDAIDLAYTRPSIDTYVIISGDGGFAALAKKLHELGKTIIGAAYRDQASRTLRAVCDDFVFLKDPEKDELATGATMAQAGASAGAASVGVTYDQDHVRQFIEKVGHEASSDSTKVLMMMRKVLEGIKMDAPLKADTLDGGLELSLMGEILRRVIPGFTPLLFGFPKLYECLQFVCTGTEFAVGKDAETTNPKLMLILRGAVPTGFAVLPDLEERPLHTVENYYEILRIGTPHFRLPKRKALRVIIQWLEGQDSEAHTLGEWLSRLHDWLGQTASEISMQDARLGLLSLLTAGVFERTPPQTPLADKKLTLKQHNENGWIAGILSDELRSKLATVLPEVSEEVFGQVVP